MLPPANTVKERLECPHMADVEGGVSTLDPGENDHPVFPEER